MKKTISEYLTAREFIDRLNKAIPEEEKDNLLYIYVARQESDPTKEMRGYERVPSGEYRDDFRIYLDAITENGLSGIDQFIPEIPF